MHNLYSGILLGSGSRKLVALFLVIYSFFRFRRYRRQLYSTQPKQDKLNSPKKKNTRKPLPPASTKPPSSEDKDKQAVSEAERVKSEVQRAEEEKEQLALFKQACGDVKTLSLSNDHQLELYALFKQSTIGVCNTTAPSRLNMVARSIAITI